MRLKEREMAEIVNRKETRNTLIVSLNERKDYQDTVQKNLSFTQGSLIIDDKDFILCGQIEDSLKKRGYHIKKLDLCHPERSCLYNPLAYIKSEKDALMVAEFILDASGNKQIEGTAEFEKAKKLLLLTCIYYVMENEKEQTLAKVKEIVQNFLDPDKMCESPAFLEGATAAYYKHFLAIDTDIRYGAIISVYFHMLSFLSVNTKAVTDTSIHSISCMKDGKDVSLFIDKLTQNTMEEYKIDDCFFSIWVKTLYAACVFYLMEHEEKGGWKDIPAIVDMLNMGLTEEKDGKTKLDILFEQVEQASFSVGYYESFKKATGCTLRTILTLCQAHLQSFIDRQKEEILLDSFMDEKTVLFINRGHRETQAVDLSALLYAQLCAIAENRAENDISSAYSVSIFIDDLATHETIPHFAYWTGCGEAYGIIFTVVLQSLGQLNCFYEGSCLSILENTNRIVFFNNDVLLYLDRQLKEYMENRFGKEFFLALNDMDKENIMECQKGTHPIILSGKEQLWQ